VEGPRVHEEVESMPDSVSLEEYKRAEREVLEPEARRAFRTHAVIYIVGNALAIALNLILLNEVLWFYYPLIGWGLGLSIHYLLGVRSIATQIANRQERIERTALRNRAS
jgi:2TM domain